MGESLSQFGKEPETEQDEDIGGPMASAENIMKRQEGIIVTS